jgi:hypothetical protein
VREAGKQSLSDIGNVIRNPEIRKLSPLLLSALHDPAKHTKDALDGLLSCEFMHSVRTHIHSQNVCTHMHTNTYADASMQTHVPASHHQNGTCTTC